MINSVSSNDFLKHIRQYWKRFCNFATLINIAILIIKKITFKIKNFDENGSILNQESINCDVLDIEDAKNLLRAIGYQEIMCIREDDVVYKNGQLEFGYKGCKEWW